MEYWPVFYNFALFNGRRVVGRDQEAVEKGTWMGVNRGGSVGILLSITEPTEVKKKRGNLPSRGVSFSLNQKMQICLRLTACFTNEILCFSCRIWQKYLYFLHKFCTPMLRNLFLGITVKDLRQDCLRLLEERQIVEGVLSTFSHCRA